MRKKSAVILIQWSLGQIKRCVHVTFFHRPMRMDGKPLDPRCNGFYSCENVRSHQFLIQLCYTTIVSWSLIQWHCLLLCLVVLSHGSEVEKPNWGSEVRCFVSYRERFDVFSSPSRITRETYPYLQFYSVSHFIFLKRSWKRGNSFGLFLSSTVSVFLFLLLGDLCHSSKDCSHPSLSKVRKYHCIPKWGDRKIRHNIWAP